MIKSPELKEKNIYIYIHKLFIYNYINTFTGCLNRNITENYILEQLSGLLLPNT